MYYSSRDNLYLNLFLLWLLYAVNFGLQGVFQGQDILMAMAFFSFFPCSILISRVFSQVYNAFDIYKKRFNIYLLFGLLSFCGMWAIHYTSGNFLWMAVVASIAISFPMIDGPLRVYFKRKIHDSIEYVFFLATLANAIHFLDYPFLRFNKITAFLGFSVALLFLIIFSIVIPLALYIRKEKEYNSFLEEKIEERTQKINLQYQELEALLEDNQTLNGIICHDLFNPISALKGSLFLLERKLKKNGQDSYEADFLKLNKVIESVIGKIEWAKKLFKENSGKMMFEEESVDLESSISEVVMQLKPRFESKALKSKVICREHKSYLVKGNGSIIADEIISNLVYNAIKFSPVNSEIVFELGEQVEFITLSIKNRGDIKKDISEEELFSFGDETTTLGTLKEKGTGIGLPIVKKCINALGGEVSLNTKTKGIVSFDLKFQKHSQEKKVELKEKIYEEPTELH